MADAVSSILGLFEVEIIVASDEASWTSLYLRRLRPKAIIFSLVRENLGCYYIPDLVSIDSSSREVPSAPAEASSRAKGSTSFRYCNYLELELRDGKSPSYTAEQWYLYVFDN